jgi:hypothetical protein
VYGSQFSTAELDVSPFEVSALSHFAVVFSISVLMGIVQKPMLMLLKKHLLLSPFFLRLYLWKVER